MVRSQTDAERPVRRGVYILPNLLTTAAMLSGFMGITMAINGRFDGCALAILMAAIFDGLDGRVARLTNSASEFGVQYDSLADLVSFGVTPAVMLYTWKLAPYGGLGLTACFLFVACGALRLARFNVQAATGSKKYFVGLPIPAAGCTMAALIFFSGYLPPFMERVLPMFSLLLAYGLSLLMVSRVRFTSFKEFDFLKVHPFGSMVTAVLLVAMVASQPKLLGFPILLGYVLSGIVNTFVLLPRRHSRMLRESRRELS